MVTLEHKDFINLVNMLEQLDGMQDVSPRRAALRQAGLQKLIPNIQLAGDANTFVRYVPGGTPGNESVLRQFLPPSSVTCRLPSSVPT